MVDLYSNYLANGVAFKGEGGGKNALKSRKDLPMIVSSLPWFPFRLRIYSPVLSICKPVLGTN